MPVQVPDVLHVVEVLREPAAHVAGLLSTSSQDSEWEQQEMRSLRSGQVFTLSIRHVSSSFLLREVG